MSDVILGNKYNDSEEKLVITDFEMGIKGNENQELFYYILSDLIAKYNEIGHEKSKKEGIYYMKDKHILLANISEEYIHNYKQFKELFKQLMTGSGRYYPKFDPNKKTTSTKNGNDNGWEIKSNSSNNSFKNKSCKSGKSRQNFYTYYYSRNDTDREIIYNLNHFCSYFNGMFFESLAAETFFSLIDKDYDSKSNQKKLLYFLPRIIYYEIVKNKIQDQKDYIGYNEIDCAFILKEKDEVKIGQEMISCFKSFNLKEESQFFKIDNIMESLILHKDDVVILEIKSKWLSLSRKEDDEKSKGKDDKKFNQLERFIRKAKDFVKHYEDLNLVKKNQKKVLIYLYNDSIHYYQNIEEENAEILKAYEMIDEEDNYQLYTAYFQSYLKMMNSYDRVRKIREQEEKITILVSNVTNQAKEMEKQTIEMENQRIEMEKQKEKIKILENQTIEMANQRIEMEKQKEKIENLENTISELRKYILKLMNEKNANSSKPTEEEEKDKKEINGKGSKDKSKKNSISSQEGTNASTINNETNN